jgi:hypothetical protein
MADQPIDIADALADCLTQIEAGHLTAEECLDRYPTYATEIRQLLLTSQALREVPPVAPSQAFRGQARQRLLAQLPASPAEPAGFFATLRYKWQQFSLIPRTRRYGMAWILALVMAASVILGGGTVLAADAAAPGDLLYPVDRSLEDWRTNLTHNPEALLKLQLSFAKERLAEAQKLADHQETLIFNQTLADYGDTLASTAKILALSEGTDQANLDQLFDRSLQDLDPILAALVGPDDETPTLDDPDGNDNQNGNDNDNDNGDDNVNDNGDDNVNDNGDDNVNDNGDDNVNDNGDDNVNDNGDDNVNDNGDDNVNDNGDDNVNDNDDQGQYPDKGAYCLDTATEVHPVVVTLSNTYDVPSEEIMDWFCGNEMRPGMGLGQIMLGLRTAASLVDEETGQPEVPYQDLLDRRLAGEGWGQIWRDLGLIGNGRDSSSSDSTDEAAPSDSAPPGQSKDKSNGPPDHSNRPDKPPKGQSDDNSSNNGKSNGNGSNNGNQGSKSNNGKGKDKS